MGNKTDLLKGKVALVTGAAGGIGKGIAEVYGEHGAHVVALDLNEEVAKALSNAIASAGGQESLGMKCDITNPASVGSCIDTVLEKFGEINVLVNNAAVLLPHNIIDFPLGDWQNTFRVNVEGTFIVSQAVARQMIKQGKGGSMITISSIAANKADPKHSAYSASKSAVITFSRVMALELGEHNIRCNCILPGATMTPMLESAFENVPGLREDLRGRNVLGKFATPRDQANAAVFLASDLASHVTGEYLIVSGGEFMNA